MNLENRWYPQKICILFPVCPCSLLWTCLYNFHFRRGIFLDGFGFAVSVKSFLVYFNSCYISSMLCYWMSSLCCISYWSLRYFHSFSYRSLVLWMVVNGNGSSVLSSAKLTRFLKLNGLLVSMWVFRLRGWTKESEEYIYLTSKTQYLKLLSLIRPWKDNRWRNCISIICCLTDVPLN